MASLDDLQKQYEAGLQSLVDGTAGRGAESDLALVRALVHKAVHLAADRKSVQFCALVSYLGEMIGHAHQLQHGGDQAAAAHHDFIH